MRLRRVIRAIHRLDGRASSRISRMRFPRPVELVLPGLTRAADHSKLWGGVAAALVATGNPQARRGALRGLGSIAVTSRLANQIGKWLVPHRRPRPDGVPLGRIAYRVPVSSSFPSGHWASAAAFAVGLATEAPALAAPVAAPAGGSGSWLPLVSGVLTGNLHRGGRYVEQRRSSFRVRLDADRGRLARDGEVSPAPASVIFSVRRRALTVFCGAADRAAMGS